eukprot:TRINITY_DN10164_c0_g1_i1.p1 TRINITY_DN10164_c0_g1~~TRINITY_DN10164_c0_g1_i1.p1  ORF type:complete len:140 (-),score=24.76 TRINITY_DN10164_c0_g1_i1:76-495(-)
MCIRDRYSGGVESKLTTFNARKLPKIGIHDYLLRFLVSADCSVESYILALIYIDRLTTSHETFLVSSMNVHRLLLVSIMSAAKFFDDKFYSNEMFSRIGGISNKELNFLELEFLSLMKFNLHVTTEVFLNYYTRVVIGD